MKTILPVLVFTIAFYACSKDSESTTTRPFVESGSIAFEFEHVVGTTPLFLNSVFYTNANGDQFNVTTFKYYISNIKFIRENGTKVSEEESYHLINAAVSSGLSFNTANIPKGTYTAIEFMVGVDSTRNVSGAQTGALDPANGMFWSWSTGYIFSMMEGTSTASPTGNIAFHITGFEDPFNSLRVVHLELPQALKVENQSMSTIHLKTNLLEMFQTPNLIKFNATYNITSASPVAPAIADNYLDMFSVDTVEN